MTYSQDCLDLIKAFEGLRLEMYNDPAGNATVGYGHLIHMGPIDGRPSEAPYKDGCSELQAELDLADDAQIHAVQMEKWVKVELTQGQYDALTDFVYNLGINKFSSSTLLESVNAGSWTDAVYQLQLWVHSGGQILSGLVKRRAAETALIKGDRATFLALLKEQTG